jgi:TolB-like protein/DNA-binding winged helix-turn-helix (wHTH) protein
MDKSGISHIARVLRGEGSSGQPSLARGFRLEKWTVRPERCLLEADGRSIQLEPKTMGVLLCLAQHAPQVVTREQFIEQVWNGRIVTDEVLSRAVSLLRSVLEDDAQSPRFVRTVPRVGYALIAPVEALALAEPETAVAASSKRVAWAIAALAIVLAGFAAAWFFRDAYRAPPDSLRLAVLPFASTGGGEAGLADGMTEDLTVSLARVPGIRVVARNSALRFKSGDADLAEAANALGASHILSGSVRETGERLRISVHLAEAASGTEIWAETYERGAGDLFALQADISKAVAETVWRKMPASAAREVPPSNPEVYRLYLQGRQQLARRGEEGLRRAKSLLEQSVAADPGFLRAQMALAWACTLLADAVPSEAAASVACADRALAALARETAMSGEVQAVQAWLEVERNRWVDAEEAFRVGLAATPDDTEMRLQHSHMLGAVGSRSAAEDEAKLALANDPLSPIAILRQSVLALWRSDDRDAAALLAKAREFDLAPSASPEVQMLLYARGGQFGPLEQALRELQRRRGQSDDWVSAVIAVLRDPAEGAAAEAALERAAAANQIDDLLHFGALALGQRHERALSWLLERPRLHTQELEFTLLAPETAGLRRLPDFQQVVTQFGLDNYWDHYGWPAQCARSGKDILCQ